MIGIIALLVSILLPSLSKANEAARSTKCASNLRQIFLACQMYAGENKNGLIIPPIIGETYTPGKREDMGYFLKSMGVYDYDNGVLWPYLSPTQKGRYDVFNCPSELSNGDVRLAHYGGLQVVPRNFTYSFNAQLRYNDLVYPNGPPAPLPNPCGIRLSDIQQPTQKIIILEEHFPNDGCAISTTRRTPTTSSAPGTTSGATTASRTATSNRSTRRTWASRPTAAVQ